MVSISRAAPAPSRICRVAAMISGPMPSPCATVMGVLGDIWKFQGYRNAADDATRSDSTLRDKARHNGEIVPLLCYLDAFSGISGDMLVGALADAGADQAAIVAAIASLDAGASVSFEKVKRAGIGATKYRVAVEETGKHRHLHHIVRMIEAADMAPRARRNAIAVFEKLGEA